MKFKITMLALLISSSAYAVNYNEPGHNPGNPNNPGIGGPPVGNGDNGNNGNNGTNNTITNSIYNSNRINTKSTNVNKAYGGNANSKSNSKSIATGGNSYATGGNATAYSGGNTQSVSVVENGDTHYSGSYDVRTVGNAPDVISYSTAPCRVAIGASGGWLGGAFGFTGSVLDDGCDIWRDVVNLTAHNYKEAADMRLCDKPELKKVLAHCSAAGYDRKPEEVVNSFNIH